MGVFVFNAALIHLRYVISFLLELCHYEEKGNKSSNVKFQRVLFAFIFLFLHIMYPNINKKYRINFLNFKQENKKK